MAELDNLAEQIRKTALETGFDLVRLADVGAVPDHRQELYQWLDEGYHGEMTWMTETAARRHHPRALWPEARSAIVLGMNYGPDTNPLKNPVRRDRANISVYARNRDYHDLIKKYLKRIARWLVAETACEVKVFVDTAPVMEKPLAQSCGLGWQGRHTNLVSQEFGSWLFIGSIFTTLALSADSPAGSHCGSCRACLDICPTRAFPKSGQLDARRCISYLTIEHKGHIEEEFRKPIANRIYGCDDCLAVCPWNKFAQSAQQTALHARQDLLAPRLSDLLQLDDEAFRHLFRGSPVKRIGRDRFIRNVLIAAGNSGDQQRVPDAVRLLDDPSPLVRAMAVWALSQLAPEEARTRSHSGLYQEKDRNVRMEWMRVRTLAKEKCQQ